MNEVEIIRGARELLSDPKRWHKGNFQDGDSYCAIGALSVAACGYATAYAQECSPALTRAVNLLRKHTPTKSLVPYNDHPDTTHEDILNLLDKALAGLGALV